jgi:hypothetical protein
MALVRSVRANTLKFVGPTYHRCRTTFAMAHEKSMDWTNKYFLGVVAAGLMILLMKRVVENQLNGKGNRRTKRPLYRSDHSILNIPLPPQSMWMNMGFWKV